ncbi:hypothetical protein EXW72_12495 [Pseudomonas sp. BCA14]|nr:hypothetical protein EXW70_13995 [Pseudomonas sp. JMN1]TFF12266.1 hypothetical protein EXW71_11745 [Pseudomonas sp. BCA17]TFF25857.1 hypothetical protein EXW73_15555 [Pseudomonas sp. BCA13]TFF29042.1 hypothetical protein EXW72_12495 [Pseudomonas sp. BCA14]
MGASPSHNPGCIRSQAGCIIPAQLRLFVGVSLLAKNSQAPRSFRQHALSLTFFASKLAPTDGTYA